MTRQHRLVVALAVVGLVVAGVAIWPRHGTPTPEGASVAGPAASATGSAAPVTGSAGAVRPGGPGGEVGRRDAGLTADRRAEVGPVRVVVEGHDIDARVRPVGVAPDGQMALPADPRVFGWYRFGPAPGVDPSGSAVIAGHLDSRRFGLGPLVRLRDVEVGDPVRVQTSDGRTTTYRVVEVTRYDRQGLPAEVFTRSGPPRLRLVTCGGEYDAERGGYQQNLVVTAAPARTG